MKNIPSKGILPKIMLLALLLQGTLLTGQADLTIEFSASRTTYLPFMNIDFELSVQNKDTVAHQVEIRLSYPDTAIVPTTTYEVSNGTYFVIGKKWIIDTLSANSTASLHFRLFTVKDWVEIPVFAILATDDPVAKSILIEPIPQSMRIPDLYVFNVELADTLPLDQEVTRFNYSLHNKGYEVAGDDFVISSYISTDTLRDETDYFIGEVLTGNINTLDTFTVGGAVQIPRELGSGEYYLLLEVDTEENIEELDETNNLLVHPIYLLNLGFTTDFAVNCPSDIHSIFPPFPEPDELNLYGATRVAAPIAYSACPLEDVKIELRSQYNYTRLFNYWVVEGNGIFDIEFVVSDRCGNEKVCNYTIQNEILEPLAYFDNCPGNMKIEAPIGADGVEVFYEMPEFVTTCTEEGTVALTTGSPESGSRFPIGTTPIRIVGETAQCGADTCNFNITVIERLSPFESIGQHFDQNQAINIAPNPASEELNIESSSTITEIRILDQLGHTLLHPAIQTHQTSVTINTANFATGVYFIKLLTLNGNQTLKFLVQR